MRWFVLAAVLFPFIDLWALVALGGHFGGLHALGYALLGGVVGVLLTRAEGLRVILRFRESLNRGEPPTDGLLSGILVVVGGLLLALPGPLSDVVGIALFAPPLRRALAAWMRERLERRIAEATVRIRTVHVQSMPLGAVVDLGGFGRAAPRATRGRAAPAAIIETDGEVVDHTTEERPRLPGPR